MENQNKPQVSNFWFGFLIGSTIAASTAFLLGTKNGRKTLSKLLELSENLEENIVLLAEELGEEFKLKAQELNIEIPKANKKDRSTIGTILNKISNLSPQQSKKQKFFIKE